MPARNPADITRVPKSFLTSIRLPAGPFAGQLAQPCPCGEPIDFDDDRTFNLIRWPDGKLLIYHDGCIADPDDA